MFDKLKLKMAVVKMQQIVDKEVTPTRGISLLLLDWVYNLIEKLPSLISELSDTYGDQLVRVLNDSYSIWKELMDMDTLADQAKKEDVTFLRFMQLGMNEYANVFLRVATLFGTLAEMEESGIAKELAKDLMPVIKQEQQKLKTILSRVGSRKKASKVTANYLRERIQEAAEKAQAHV